jgi:CRP/FNR family transcriptional regulator
METRRCLLCLRELPLFRALSGSDFAGICLSATKRRVPRGDYLFRQGERSAEIYLIKAGKLKLVQVSPSGREVILDVVGRGEVLGETALFREQEQMCSAVALEDASVCSFGRPQFEAFIRANPDLALSIISYLGAKLYESTQQAGESAGRPVREKLLQTFLRLAEEHGQARPAGTLIALALTQEELASMVGASRVQVANVLRELREEGVIARDGRHYLLKRQPCVEKHFSAPAQPRLASAR